MALFYSCEEETRLGSNNLSAWRLGAAIVSGRWATLPSGRLPKMTKSGLGLWVVVGEQLCYRPPRDCATMCSSLLVISVNTPLRSDQGPEAEARWAMLTCSRDCSSKRV